MLLPNEIIMQLKLGIKRNGLVNFKEVWECHFVSPKRAVVVGEGDFPISKFGGGRLWVIR